MKWKKSESLVGSFSGFFFQVYVNVSYSYMYGDQEAQANTSNVKKYKTCIGFEATKLEVEVRPGLEVQQVRLKKTIVDLTNQITEGTP